MMDALIGDLILRIALEVSLIEGLSEKIIIILVAKVEN